MSRSVRSTSRVSYDLEHVAFLHVVEAVEEDAALEALADLARVVLEALQLRDRSSS